MPRAIIFLIKKKNHLTFLSSVPKYRGEEPQKASEIPLSDLYESIMPPSRRERHGGKRWERFFERRLETDLSKLKSLLHFHPSPPFTVLLIYSIRS